MTLGPVLVGIDDPELTAAAQEQLLHPLVGGVVLFKRNFEDRDQLRALVAAIRELRQPRLLLAVDQEGGRVQRFRKGFTRLPAPGRIGEIRHTRTEKAPDYAYWHGRIMAAEMLELGIDLSFAPVLDLDRGSEVIGDRAFSGEPEVVIELGRAYIAGMHDAGMKTTGKHFPGHGSVRDDSHVVEVRDERALDEIEATDFQPFAALAGELDAMMIAHVVYPCLDDRPAGYSPAWLGDRLRLRMGYRGVIFSDDLGMHAATAPGSLAQRTRAALNAGCDAALVCRPEDVTALVSEWGGVVPDATARLQTLYGAPDGQASGDDGTIRQWRDRLERLC